MLDKLDKFDLQKADIEKVKASRSRDGFVLLDNKEFNGMKKYFGQFPIYKDIVAIITDQNSNYWCLYISGPLKGMICYVSHDEPNLAPRFNTISSFLKVIDEHPEVYDFYDLEAQWFDFPQSQKNTESGDHKPIIEKLKADFNAEADDDVKQQIAFSIIALTSIEDIESNIYPFLDSDDIYIQESAIQILGFHKYMPAKEKLANLKKTAMYNGRRSAEIALKKLRGY